LDVIAAALLPPTIPELKRQQVAWAYEIFMARTSNNWNLTPDSVVKLFLTV
jgi:hypothetical protein